MNDIQFMLNIYATNITNVFLSSEDEYHLSILINKAIILEFS